VTVIDRLDATIDGARRARGVQGGVGADSLHFAPYGPCDDETGVVEDHEVELQ
jgi:hypothetical protein